MADAMISVAEARARILAAVKPLPAETIAVADAVGRVTAIDIVARRTQPPMAVSAMDGWACRSADVVPLTVSDAEATAACVRLAEDHGQMIEPACGVALAPLYTQQHVFAGLRRVVAVVCGGQVVTLGDLARWQGEQG